MSQWLMALFYMSTYLIISFVSCMCKCNRRGQTNNTRTYWSMIFLWIVNHTTFVWCKLKKYPCQTEQSNELHSAPEILLLSLRFCLSVVCSMWCGYLICGLGPLRCFISTCWGRNRCVISSCEFETLLIISKKYKILTANYKIIFDSLVQFLSSIYNMVLGTQTQNKGQALTCSQKYKRPLLLTYGNS